MSHATREPEAPRGRRRSRKGRADAQRRQQDRRRAGLLLLSLGVVLTVVGVVGAVSGGGSDSEDAPKTKADANGEAVAKPPSRYGKPTPTPLPPETRVVAFAGAPQADALGILGKVSLTKAAEQLERQGRPYDRKSRPVLGAYDLITTIADAHPGSSGNHRTRQKPSVVARHLRAARRANVALILDIQPGNSNFPDEVAPLERWLKEPDVHLALDPEWRMRPGVRPGSEIGWVSAGELQHTLERVAELVREHDLPKKLVLVHRFTDGMVRDLETVKVPEEIVPVISIDGVGTRALKTDTYNRIAPNLPKPWLAGFKVFYEEDAEAGGVMSGAQVMALQPRPHVVLYE